MSMKKLNQDIIIEFSRSRKAQKIEHFFPNAVTVFKVLRLA